MIFWIPESKTPSGRAELPLTELAAEAFRDQIELAGPGDWLFPSSESKSGHLESVKKGWRKTLENAGITYFRIYDLRSTFGTRLSAGGVSDEWVTQMLRQGDAKVFKKYSRMKLQMRREALGKLDRLASERNSVTVFGTDNGFCHGWRQNEVLRTRRQRVTIVESRSPRNGRLAQPVRAPALQAGGRWFDPVTAHHCFQPQVAWPPVFREASIALLFRCIGEYQPIGGRTLQTSLR
jgi:Phage integrase family